METRGETRTQPSRLGAMVGRVDAWPWLVALSLIVALVRGTGVGPDTLLTGAQFGALALALVLLWVSPRDGARHTKRWPYYLAGGFAALCALSAAWSPVPSITITRALVFGFLLLFILETARIRWSGPSTLRKDLLALFWFAVALSAAGLILALFGVPGMVGDYQRFKGFTVNATVAAWIAAIAFPLGYSQIFKSGKNTRIALALGAVVLGVAVAASGTRGALLALLGAVALVHLLSRKGWWVGGATAAGVAAAIAFTFLGSGVAVTPSPAEPAPAVATPASPATPAAATPPAAPTQPSVGRVAEPTTDISSGRLGLWTEGLNLWQERPLGGWGFGTTSYLPGFDDDGMSLHNAYLSVLVETGAVGALVFAALLVTLFAGAKLRAMPGVVAAAAVVLVNGMFESSLVNLGSPVTTESWVVLGALLAAGQLSRRTATESAGRSD